jgi:hypothetical protein
MKEEFLYYLWRFKLFNDRLFTVDGDEIKIISSGERNYDSGPDFLFAKVKIGDTLWVGNVEMHVKSSDWIKHGHDNDDAYDNVILHVVYENDMVIKLKNGYVIPVFEVKNNFDIKFYENYLNLINSSDDILCSRLLNKVSNLIKLFWLERMMTDRLMVKAITIEKELKNSNIGYQEIFYRKLARNFGFKTNGDAFEMLAHSLPLKIILKYIDSRFQIEALLFGQSGLLSGDFNDSYPQNLKKEYKYLSQKFNLKNVNPAVWRFMRMRPNNFPTIRISQFAALLHKSGGLFYKIPEIKRISDIRELLTVNASEYWNNHYRFDKLSKGKEKVMGNNSVNLIMINTVIPYVFVYGRTMNKQGYRAKALDWLEQLKPENNKIVRLFKNNGFPVINAMHTQAIIHMKTEYCDKKLCLECGIGQTLLQEN